LKIEESQIALENQDERQNNEVDMFVDDDDVFVQGECIDERNKENHPRTRTRQYNRKNFEKQSARANKTRICSSALFGISPPAPHLSLDEAVCVNSPERRKLQEVGLECVSEGVKNSSGYDIKLLGKGGYGTVVFGSWKSMRVAVKVIARDDKMLSKSRRRTSLDSEMNATRIPEHENVVKVHGIFDGMEALHSSVIVMEYVGHYNLQNVIESQPQKLQRLKAFNSTKPAYYFLQTFKHLVEFSGRLLNDFIYERILSSAKF
jgi:hypothetical protein